MDNKFTRKTLKTCDWKIRVLFIVESVKHLRNDSVTVINRNDWKKKIVVGLSIVVDQMSYNGNFLPSSYLPD